MNHSENSAPKIPVGTAINTANGTDHDSYNAAKHKKTNTSANAKTCIVELDAFFSSRDCPDHSILNPVLASWRTISSIAFIAWPEEYPSAALPWICTERAPLNREIWVGPVDILGVMNVLIGIIWPVELRTDTNLAASASPRYITSDCKTTLYVLPNWLKSLTW